MILPFLLAAVPALPQDVPRLTAPAQHMVHVEVTPRTLRRLTSLDLDVAKLDLVASHAEVIVTEEELAQLATTGLNHQVVIRDLATYYAERLASDPGSGPAAGSYGGWLSPPFGNGGMGGYYTLNQIGSVLDQMRASYPNLISAKQSMGNSLEGRPIWWVRISDNPDTDENEPEVRFDSLHHAREPQGMQCNLWFMLYLLEEYGSDPLATYLVDNREIYCVPCVNPDGYEYNRQQNPGGGGLWRKNRRNNGGGSFGVDLNRNYPYNWGYDNNGSSSNPDSETYRGASAASEPEIQAMTAFISARDFETALSIHTYGNYWLAPWGFDEQYPGNWNHYDEVGALVTAVNGYEHGPGSIVLYEANGVTFDYDHGQHGTLSWTPEIGSSNDGFWPSQSRIIPLAQDNELAFIRTALAGGPWIVGESLSVVDVGDGDGDFEVNEPVELTAVLRNSGTVVASTVDLTLTSSSPWLSITQPNASAGPISSFSSGANALPLAMVILPGAPEGTALDFVVEVTIDGWTQYLPGELVIGSEITLASYDFEGSNQGWSVGNPNDASTGEWTRVNPIGTDAQPEDDHSVSGTQCFVTGQGSNGGSIGENDVDGGYTTLVSPIWDLDGALNPRITYWRWYSNDKGSAPNADILEIDISNDGGSNWVSAEVVGPSGAGSNGGWYEATIDVASLVTPTSQVRMRVTASDLNSGSIVEAALDDVVVTYFEGSSCAQPANYCTSTFNSSGLPAFMGWSGSIDADDDAFTLNVSQTPANKFGLFFYGPGQQQTALGDGFLCVDGSLVRFDAVVTSGAGTASWQVDLPAEGITNGDTLNFQFWFRDPTGGPAGSNLSDGLNVTFCAD